MDKQHWHMLSEIDSVARTATCSICGPTRIRPRGDGRWRCSTVGSRLYKKARSEDRPWTRKPHHRLERDSCQLVDCPYGADHLCLIDVHHIDGDHKNNKRENLIPLCALCHRLVTYKVCTLVMDEGGARLEGRPRCHSAATCL